MKRFLELGSYPSFGGSPARSLNVWHFAVLSLAWLGGAIGMSPVAQGQRNFRISQLGDTATLLPPPRSVRQQIREADAAIEEERYSDAVIRLGDLLRRASAANLPETAQDYFVDSEDGIASGGIESGGLEEAMIEQELRAKQADATQESLAPTTVMRLVRQKIGDLPTAGRELYQLRYGPLAAKQLEQARASISKTASGTTATRGTGFEHDWHAVEQVRREYFHTEAGYRASYLLAMREWLLGNPLAVIILLDDIVVQPDATRQLGDGVTWLHAGATLLADRPIVMPARLPADSKIDPSDVDGRSKWETAVRQRFSTESRSQDPVFADYAFLGARPGRNGPSQGQMPLSNPRWMLETSGSPRQEKMITSETEQLKATGLLPPPSWMPLRVGDQLLMRTTQRLVGVDHRTGKRVWQYPWFAPPEPESSEDQDDPNDLRRREDPSEILTQRVWNDAPYGQLSSDGQRVYMIDNLNSIQSERINPFGMRATRSLQASKNTLVALDLATQGKLLWRLGMDENEPSALSDAFFLGPPLPVRGRLYAMVEVAGEVLLVCLDPVDGTEEWRQVLVSVESSGITSDPVRRVAGAMPSYHDGLLICPTGAGATVAVDLIDRTLRWVRRHQRSQPPVQHVFRPPPEISLTRLSQRWATSVAIASGNHVALTPTESDRLIVVDPLTGVERFSPQPRIKNLYLAGIRNDQYIVVRADRVIGYDINTGTELWSTPSDLMQSGQRVSGRGVFGSTNYFLPTSNNELIEISLEDGRILSRRRVRFPLGNLLAIGGEIISQATTSLAVAYGEQTLEPMVNQQLQDDPDDFFATVRKAELLLEKDQREPALNLLAKAREIDPQNDEVILLSVEAMLGALRAQKTLSARDVDVLKDLIERPEQSAELLALQISRLTEAELWEASFDLLLELSDLLVDRPSLDGQQALILPTDGRSFSLSAWVSARVAQIAVGADETTLDSIHKTLQSHVANRRISGQSASERMLSHFISLAPSIASSYNGQFDRAIRQGDFLAGERMAWATQMPNDNIYDQLPIDTLLKLAKTYSEGRWNDDWNAIAQALNSRELSGDQQQLVDQTLESFMAKGPQRIGHEWPASVKLDWQSTRQFRSNPLTTDRRHAKTIHLMGRMTEGWQAISDNSPLALLNENGIARSIVVEGLTARNSSDKEVTLSGGLMLVLTPSELIAIDLFRVLNGGADETVRWRRSLSPDGQAVAKLRSEKSKFGDEIYRYLTNTRIANAGEAQLRLGPVLGDRLFLLQGSDLICFDCVSGQTQWRSDIGYPGSGVVARDGRVAVISEQGNRVMSFDWFDGRLIEVQPLPVAQLMTTVGQHALITSPYEGSELSTDLYDPQLVEILDPITMKRMGSRVASPVNLTDQDRTSGYAKLIEGRYFALLDNVGRLTLWDVLKGEEIADVEIPTRENLFDLSLVRIKNRFLVFPRSKINEGTLRAVSSVTVASGSSSQGATSVHCIELIRQTPDKATADKSTKNDSSKTPVSKLAWSQVFDQARGVTVHQPYETPMLLMARGKLFNNTSTASRRREMDLWGLDVRTGEIMTEMIAKQVGSTNPRIDTDVRLIPHRNQIVTTIQSEFLTFTFSDRKMDDDSDSSNRNSTDKDGDVDTTETMTEESP